MTNELLRTLRPAWIPLGILAATALLAWLVRLPDSLAGLTTFGPLVVLGAGAAMAWRFTVHHAWLFGRPVASRCHVFPPLRVT